MAKFDTSFNFGANVKPKKAGAKKGKRRKVGGKAKNAGQWAQYVGGK